MTSSDAVGEARVIVGVDTHRDEHVAVAIDRPAARLGEHRLSTTLKGYEGLDRWRTNAQMPGIEFFRHVAGSVCRQPSVTLAVSRDRSGTWNWSAWRSFSDFPISSTLMRSIDCNVSGLCSSGAGDSRRAMTYVAARTHSSAQT